MKKQENKKKKTNLKNVIKVHIGRLLGIII